MNRRNAAVMNFQQGYNCAQSVVLAFQDLLPIAPDTLSKMASSFGGGMGRLREVCGAVSGMFMVLGLLRGYAEPQNIQAKQQHYASVQELARSFEKKHGSLICRELLNLKVLHDTPVPEERTESYYNKRPCVQLVGDAAELLEEYLIRTACRAEAFAKE